MQEKGIVPNPTNKDCELEVVVVMPEIPPDINAWGLCNENANWYCSLCEIALCFRHAKTHPIHVDQRDSPWKWP